MKYLIHIGFHKTGTSFLQKKLFAGNIPGLTPIVPYNFDGISNGKSAKLFGAEIIREVAGNVRPNIEQLKEKLNNYKLPSEGYNVISNEALSGIGKLSFAEKSTIQKTLSNLFPDSKILIGIREQRSWIESLYYQYLRMGGTLSPRRYFELSEINYFPNSFVGHHLYYSHLVNQYITSFGRDNVFIYAHEDLVNTPFNVIDNIQKFLKLNLNVKDQDLQNKVNTKLSLSSLEISRIFSPVLFRVQGNAFSSLGIIKSESRRNSFLKQLNAVTPRFAEKRLRYRLRKSIPVKYDQGFKESNKELSVIMDRNLLSLGYMM